MFPSRRFSAAENDFGTPSNVKTSAQRTIKRDVADQFPDLEPYLEDIFPKKSDIMEARG